MPNIIQNEQDIGDNTQKIGEQFGVKSTLPFHPDTNKDTSRNADDDVIHLSDEDITEEDYSINEESEDTPQNVQTVVYYPDADSEIPPPPPPDDIEEDVQEKLMEQSRADFTEALQELKGKLPVGKAPKYTKVLALNDCVNQMNSTEIEDSLKKVRIAISEIDINNLFERFESNIGNLLTIIKLTPKAIDDTAIISVSGKDRQVTENLLNEFKKDFNELNKIKGTEMTKQESAHFKKDVERLMKINTQIFELIKRADQKTEATEEELNKDKLKTYAKSITTDIKRFNDMEEKLRKNPKKLLLTLKEIFPYDSTYYNVLGYRAGETLGTVLQKFKESYTTFYLTKIEGDKNYANACKRLNTTQKHIRFLTEAIEKARNCDEITEKNVDRLTTTTDKKTIL